MSKRRQLPLRHPNWLPHADALDLTLRHKGSLEPALDTLDAALASGDLPIMLVERKGEALEHTLLPESSWRNGDVKVGVSAEWIGERRELTTSWRDEIEVMLRGKPDNSQRWLFVWKPELERLLGIAASAESREVSKPGEAKRPRAKLTRVRKAEQQAKPEYEMIRAILAPAFPRKGPDYIGIDIRYLEAAVRDGWKAECEVRDKRHLIGHPPDRYKIGRAIGRHQPH